MAKKNTRSLITVCEWYGEALILEEFRMAVAKLTI